MPNFLFKLYFRSLITKVAMELKLLRIEAKVALRDSRRQQRRQPAIADRLPPIAATPSTPNRSDEEMDSFDELELTPRGTNRHGAGSGLCTHGGLMHRSGGPANIAVVTRSGASVASAVTATSFQEGDFANANDGDIEDEVEDNDDVSESSKYFAKSQCSIDLVRHELFTQRILRIVSSNPKFKESYLEFGIHSPQSYPRSREQ
jgi:hypothetical protein